MSHTCHSRPLHINATTDQVSKSHKTKMGHHAIGDKYAFMCNGVPKYLAAPLRVIKRLGWYERNDFYHGEDHVIAIATIETSNGFS
jgi:hypothetical protein